MATSTYTYAGTGDANPHAVTQIANGVSTTTFNFDNNGNVIQKLTDGPHDISMGLRKRTHSARRQQRDHHLRLRRFRLSRLSIYRDNHIHLSIEVVFGRFLDGKRREICDHH